MPPTLRGRWRLDQRTGLILAAVVALAAAVLGGWAYLRAQSHSAPTGRDIPAAHGSHYGGAAEGGDRHGPRSRDSDGGSAGAADPAGGGDQADASAPPGTARGDGAYPDAGPGSGADADTAAGTAGAAPGRGSLVIDVEGKVARPGVEHLPAGSRVMDALKAAGGALPGTDLTPLDQARLLTDGEQLLVGMPGQAAAPADPNAPAPRAGGRKSAPTSPVHLNSADLAQLEELPGVGPALAQRILDWRSAHGSFSSVAQLQQVQGLGGRKYSALKQWVQL